MYAALGDSITVGYEGTPSGPPTCAAPNPVPYPSGCPAGSTDYPAQMSGLFYNHGTTNIRLQNLGVGGAEITDVQSSELNFTTTATVVGLYIGTNDIECSFDRSGGTLTAFENNYVNALQQIHSHDPFARVVVATVPNQALLKGNQNCHGTVLSGAQITALDTPSRQVDHFILQLPSSGTLGFTPLVVDLACPDGTYDPYSWTYTSDGLHPNTAGYLGIATRFYNVLTGATHSPPSTCSADQ